jgi:hypothetical protein
MNYPILRAENHALSQKVHQIYPELDEGRSSHLRRKTLVFGGKNQRFPLEFSAGKSYASHPMLAVG